MWKVGQELEEAHRLRFAQGRLQVDIGFIRLILLVGAYGRAQHRRERLGRSLLQGMQQIPGSADRLAKLARFQGNGNQRPERCPLLRIGNGRGVPGRERIPGIFLSPRWIIAAPGDPGQIGMRRTHAILEIVVLGLQKVAKGIGMHSFNLTTSSGKETKRHEIPDVHLDVADLLCIDQRQLEQFVSSSSVSVEYMHHADVRACSSGQPAITTGLAQA